MCIADSALAIGDIIVSTTSAIGSGVICMTTFSNVSHAMLYVGNGQVIEAIGNGVVERTLPTALGGATVAVAYRRSALTPNQAAAVVSFVRRQVGNGYDHTGAVGAGLRANPVLCIVSGIVVCTAAHTGLLQRRERFYCSELVLEAFRQAAVPIVAHQPGVSTPQDIVTAYGSGTLEYVGHLRP
jgi:cell wall-associated NlpC family hydrolase